MTTEEAKKAGFRPTRTALMNCWHLTKAGSIENVGVEFDNLSADDFPTRAKARDALRKRKLEAEHAKWLADMQAQTTPITPEQLELLHVGKDTVWAVHIAYGNSITREIYDGNKTFKCFHFSEASALATKQRLDDYEHEKWIKNHESQPTPITQEQAKMLRDGDRIYGFKYGCVDAEHLVCFENPVTVGCVDDIGIIKAGKAYFTLDAAQAALDKAKLSRYERQHPYMDDAQYAACVEARDWDGADRRVEELDKAKASTLPEGVAPVPEDYEFVDPKKEPNTTTENSQGWLVFIIGVEEKSTEWERKPDGLYNHSRVGWFADPTVTVARVSVYFARPKAKAEAEPLEWCEREDGDLIQPDSGDDISIDGGKTWKPQWKSGVIFDTVKGDLRARYRNPLWLAKHVKAVESHETPVGEKQGKEVVTDETQPKPSCDAVSHPSHYTSHPSGVECITITKHMNFCRGNAVKYLWRAGQKGDSLDKEIEDIAKAEEYCRTEKERLIATKGAK